MNILNILNILNMNDFDGQFYNPNSELDEGCFNEIHLHRVSRGTRKCDVIIQGLIFKKDDESKKLINLVSKKFGISGCFKMMQDYDNKNKVYVFTGDKRDEIVEILIEKYNRTYEHI